MDKLEKAVEKARQKRAGAVYARPLSGASPRMDGVVFEADTLLSESWLEENRIVSHKTRCPEADTFKLLRTQVLQAMSKGGFRTLAITSPDYGDGKTTVAINLALSIALDLNQTVLLVDLDLRKPSLDSYLGVHASVGLTDVLAGQASVPDCLRRLSYERLSLLPAGSRIDNSSEALGSPQMADLADELKARYPDRLVIYDMPPILAQDDPLAFLPHADSILLVLRDGVTRTEDLKRALNILAPANLIGTVLNARESD